MTDTKTRHLPWRERAVGNGRVTQWLLAEDDYGDICVPAPWKRPKSVDGMWWAGSFSPWKPWHWLWWLRSRLACNIVMIERFPGATTR